MGDLVDSQEQILIGSGAKDVGYRPKPERPEWRRPEKIGENDLESDDAGDNKLGQWLRAAKPRDLVEYLVD